MSNLTGIQAVDLFCGAGGLTKGLSSAGIDVTLGVDVDENCEYPFAHNNRATFLQRSVHEVCASDLEPFFDAGCFRLLAGCAPCQTFSTYNQKASSDDNRWSLLNEFQRLIEEISPELVTMENVPGLAKYPVFDEFLSALNHLEYEYTVRVVDCSEYGLPQRRRRLVVLASRLGKPKLLTPSQFSKTRYRTVEQAIGHLPPLDAGEVDTKDKLHQSVRLSKLNMKRMKASSPGGSWRNWPKSLQADCHKAISGKTYVGVYGRMLGNEPSPTITTQFYGFGNGRFGHPTQDRALSLREGAILQGFPKSYAFVPPEQPITKKVVGRLIGNAVPVTLGKLIGKSFVRHLGEVKE